MKNIIVLLQTIILCFLCSFFSCDYRPQKGYVIDSESKLPIKNAAISLSKWKEWRILTDKSGFFKFDPKGNKYELIVECPEYKPFYVEVNRDRDGISYKALSKYYEQEMRRPYTFDSVEYIAVYPKRINKYSAKYTISNDTIWLYLVKNKTVANK